ncbi:MAG: hypothetical protein ACYCVL_01325 [Gemmatimonadaceae bacterium]
MSEVSRGAFRAIVVLALPAVVVFGACSKSQQEQPKTPIAQMTAGAADSTANPHDAMSPAARAALDSGNTAYRAGKYADALKNYRSASEQAPLNAAPFFGIYMVAEKMGNKKLADSAGAEIRRRSNGTTQMLSDSALQSLHAAGTKKNGKG